MFLIFPFLYFIRWLDEYIILTQHAIVKACPHCKKGLGEVTVFRISIRQPSFVWLSAVSIDLHAVLLPSFRYATCHFFYLSLRWRSQTRCLWVTRESDWHFCFPHFSHLAHTLIYHDMQQWRRVLKCQHYKQTILGVKRREDKQYIHPIKYSLTMFIW